MKPQALIRAIASAATATAPDSEIPSFESVSRAYGDQLAKRAELWSRVSELEIEQRTTVARLGDSWLPAGDIAVPRIKRLHAILGDKLEQRDQVHSVESDGRRLRAIQVELKDLHEALELLGKRIEETARTASPLVCEKVRPTHDRLARELLRAMLAMYQANMAYSKFTDALDRGGVSWAHLRPIFPAFLGNPDDANCPFAQFFFEAVNDGWLSVNDLPAELRVGEFQ